MAGFLVEKFSEKKVDGQSTLPLFKFSDIKSGKSKNIRWVPCESSYFAEGSPLLWIMFFQHYNIGQKNRKAICPYKNYREDCPICNAVSSQWREYKDSKIVDDAKSRSISKLFATETYLMNLLDMDDLSKGIQTAFVPKSIITNIVSKIALGVPFYDTTNGVPLVITPTDGGEFRKYSVEVPFNTAISSVTEILNTPEGLARIDLIKEYIPARTGAAELQNMIDDHFNSVPEVSSASGVSTAFKPSVQQATSPQASVSTTPAMQASKSPTMTANASQVPPIATSTFASTAKVTAPIVGGYTAPQAVPGSMPDCFGKAYNETSKKCEICSYAVNGRNSECAVATNSF